MKRYLTLILIVHLVVAVLAAETVLRDPDIPDGETTRYWLEKEDGGHTVRESVRLSDDGNLYRFESDAPETRRILHLERSSMEPVILETETAMPGYTLSSRQVLEKISDHIDDDRIPLLGGADLGYVLRGFPFGERESVTFRFFSDEDNGDENMPFRMSAVYRGTETLELAGRTIDCHVIELEYRLSGMMALFKGMLPRTRFWYAAQAPHYLVRYENKGGRGGPGDMTLEIAGYSGW